MRAKDRAARDAGDTWDVLTDEERIKAIELTKVALRAKRMGKLFLRLGANKKGIENAPATGTGDGDRKENENGK